jgi:hypothetical protein
VRLHGNGGVLHEYKGWYFWEIFMSWKWNYGDTYTLIFPKDGAINKVVAIPLPMTFGSNAERNSSVVQYYLHNLLEEVYRCIDHATDYKSMLQYLMDR